MNQATKNKIRARIVASGQQDIGEIYPECFMTTTKGRFGLIPFLGGDDSCPMMQCIVFVDTDPLGLKYRVIWEFGHN